MIIERTTLRINRILKNKIKLLAVENELSFNKMINQIIEIGYLNYKKNFYEEDDNKNKKIKEGM